MNFHSSANRVLSQWLAVILLSLGVSGASSSLRAEEVASSFVRVNATLQSYNFFRPWDKSAPSPRRGLGAVLEGNRVLVTAELCANATYVELENPENGIKAPAEIAAIDYEANLALLIPAPDAPPVLEGRTPVELDTSVKAGDTVEIWQTEDNGNPISTEVDVIRVNVGRYFLPGSVFLIYQVKGSLQSRVNSFTLPTLRDGKLVGMLISYSSDEQVANILPAPIIKTFLDDLSDGSYAGFPSLGISFASTLDPVLREYYQIEDQEGGILIRKTAPESSADKAGLQAGDVILSIDGQAVDSRGNYEDAEYGTLSFAHLVRGAAQAGKTIPAEIVRDGEVLTKEIKLLRRSPEEQLIDPYMFDRGPNYHVFGGLIFQELTQPFLRAWGNDWKTRAPSRLVNAILNPEKYEEEGRRKIVFLTNVVKTPSTLGYERAGSAIVETVNGKPILDLQDLVDAFQEIPESGIHEIKFESYPKIVHVDDRVSRMVNEQLLQRRIISRLQRIE